MYCIHSQFVNRDGERTRIGGERVTDLQDRACFSSLTATSSERGNIGSGDGSNPVKTHAGGLEANDDKRGSIFFGGRGMGEHDRDRTCG